MCFVRIMWNDDWKGISLGTFLELIEPGTPVRWPGGGYVGETTRTHFRCRRCNRWRVGIRLSSVDLGYIGHRYPCISQMTYWNGTWIVERTRCTERILDP